MLGSLNPKIRRVNVVGGGIAGLLAAYQLDKCGYEVSLFEKQSRVGGMIATTRLRSGIAEAAAHSILASPPVVALFAELGSPLTAIQRNSRARYILRDQRLMRFPLRVTEALTLLLRAYFVRARSGTASAPLSMEAWADRHLGVAARKYLLDPFLTGVYGASPAELTVGAAFPRLMVMPGNSLVSQWVGRKLRPNHYRVAFPALPEKQAHDSRTGDGAKEKEARPQIAAGQVRGICTPVHGMQSLVSGLEGELRRRLGNRFHVGAEVTSSDLNDQEVNWVLAVPAQAASQLLSKVDPISAQALAKVPYSPLISVTVICERRLFGVPPSGVGLLIPSCEEKNILGILFNSSAFEGRVVNPERMVSLTVMLGGTRDPEILGASDEEIRDRVMEAMSELLGMTRDSRSEQSAEPGAGSEVEMKIHRCESAIPQYGLPLMQAWTALRQGWASEPGHIVFGNYSGQVSIRGMIETLDRLWPC